MRNGCYHLNLMNLLSLEMYLNEPIVLIVCNTLVLYQTQKKNSNGTTSAGRAEISRFISIGKTMFFSSFLIVALATSADFSWNIPISNYCRPVSFARSKDDIYFN